MAGGWGTWSRRGVLGAGLAAAVAGMARGRAAGASGRRFVFVFANGGWDNTRVLTPMMHSPLIVPEPDAVRVDQGSLSWVDHPARPAVRRFFERMGGQIAVLDGLLVRSINHRMCVRLVQTGDTDPRKPDWASILGDAVAGSRTLPAVVLEGPSNPGPLQRHAHVLGRPDQFQDLIDGDAWQRGDHDVIRLYQQARDRVGDLVRANSEARFAATTDPAWKQQWQAHLDALGRVEQLDHDLSGLALGSGGLEAQVDAAVDLLAAGVCRCTCLSAGGFDTHANNDDQTGLLDRLFENLRHLQARLESTTDRDGVVLSDDTVVVVYSEMGRTPYLNDNAGKDHWPYTAAMLWGPGVRGGVRVGGYDDFLMGQPVDLGSGEVWSGGTVLTPGNLGATVLALGGVDPGLWLAEGPVGAVMA